MKPATDRILGTRATVTWAYTEGLPEIARIKLTMPNLHHLLADLSPFGQDNPNHIFVPIDEPHGFIEATIEH